MITEFAYDGARYIVQSGAVGATQHEYVEIGPLAARTRLPVDELNACLTGNPSISQFIWDQDGAVVVAQRKLALSYERRTGKGRTAQAAWADAAGRPWEREVLPWTTIDTCLSQGATVSIKLSRSRFAVVYIWPEDQFVSLISPGKPGTEESLTRAMPLVKALWRAILRFDSFHLNLREGGGVNVVSQAGVHSGQCTQEALERALTASNR